MAKLSFFDLIRDQRTTVPPVEVADLTGKTVMVIGANTGLGFEASKHFAMMNPHRLVLGCRSQTKGKAAIQKIKEETGFEKLELWLIDLSDFSSVVAFSKKFIADGDRLDILVENAAVAKLDYTQTGDGWETTIQVNNLSLPLLALLLLPQMIKTAETHSTLPRLVVVGSEVHYFAKFKQKVLDSSNPLKTLSDREYCTSSIMRARYTDSKLLNLFFVRALNERLRDLPLIVNCVNPGYCYSELRRDAKGIIAVVLRLVDKALARTSEEGSRMLIYAAIGGSTTLEQMRGGYINLANVCEPSDFVLGENGKKIQNKFWDNLISELVAIDSEVQGVVDKYLV
ncbi:hypothetical protein BDQ17DRAFT_1309044 [Cyathus striatus]|nr:hypothetical protein BDQ17DRAFT_1309044 [Cyathus striatus]